MSEPVTATLARAIEISGISRSQFYREMAKGNIRALKSGRSLLIDLASLKAHLSSLPVATFRAPAKGA